MLSHMVLLSILLLCEVKAFEFSDTSFKDMNNNGIRLKEYCENKSCLLKCCPNGQFMAGTREGIKCVTPKSTEIKKLLNFSQVNLYKRKGSSVIKSKKNLTSEFVFIQNDIFLDSSNTFTFDMCDIFILEDGSLKTNFHCIEGKILEYCVDFYYVKNSNSKSNVVLSYRVLINTDPEVKSKLNFVAVGMLISAFFILLVLLVYTLIPRLNILFINLMAYLLTLMFAYILKAAQLIALDGSAIDTEECRITTPVVYYLILSSFFWLNVISVDLWWASRHTGLNNHRQGEWMKFMWYGLYAWGAPALVTLICVVVDRLELYTSNCYKPPFDSCFANKLPTALYVQVPIGIMTVVNWMLFMLTAYNIWKLKRAVNSGKDLSISKNSSKRYITYLNLCILMGLNWILELVPDLPLVPYIIVNFYNVFIGVAIFITFVCKKSIFIMLCKRFNIRSSYVDKMRSYDKLDSTETSFAGIDSKYQSKDEEAAESSKFTTVLL